MGDNGQHYIAVVGAGPAGLFAAREAASCGARVVLFNRDIKPGGLAEYGIYPNKYKMKEGLRNQFRQILAMENIDYYGNVLVGQHGDLTLEDLQTLGFQAILVTAGAQGTKWLGLPGEELSCVYHAKDLVYHYNSLPPYSERSFCIGKRIAIIGVGNVMTDIAYYLIHDKKVEKVIAIARRGPGEVKFERKELERIVANLDLQEFGQQIDRLSGLMRSLNQDPDAVRAQVQTALVKAAPIDSNTRLEIQFLMSPTRFLADEGGDLVGVEVEQNELYLQNGEVKARGTGKRQVLDVDTVIFAIGDKVDGDLGLPVASNEYVKNKAPLYPIDGVSFEAYDPQRGEPMKGVFVAGWSRQASTGLVGIARKDGVSGAQAVAKYLSDVPELDPAAGQDLLARLERCLKGLQKQVVDKHMALRLQELENHMASERGLPDYKFKSNQEMLNAISEHA